MSVDKEDKEAGVQVCRGDKEDLGDLGASTNYQLPITNYQLPITK
ncbi:hypothetical protein [Chroococcidiopsis sp [FACHB-1243]]|nr:hypothetical protein [Chroococcidiopsis sp. [FACHB-1243]]